jgi:predicted ribosome quality control (RQC) complex YloA/Tae2 family protein
MFEGKEVSACFSQTKNEMILEAVGTSETKFLKAQLNPPQIFLSFPEDFKRAKQHSMNYFKELIGDRIIDCQVLPFERAFYFKMVSGRLLLFKLHGNRSNILLYEANSLIPSKVFRNELIEDKTIDWTTLGKELVLSFEEFERLEGNASKFLPTLGIIPRNWLKSKGYLEANLTQKWALIEELLDCLESPLFTIASESAKVYLSLLPESNPISSFSNPVQAANELYYLAFVKGNFDREKSALLKKYQDQLKRLHSYLDKSSKKLEELQEAAPPSELADVIMANLHLFQHGVNELELLNFYSGKLVKVQLKHNQKAQDLAASLYRKSKNRKLEWDQLEKNISLKGIQSQELEAKIQELEEVNDFRGFKTFKKGNGEDKVLQKEAEVLPFKVFEFEGYTIWVGKSAQANDEMLRNYTKKEDLWLHARMVSGSHVLIKKSINQSIPQLVLETAAQLAAHYSKSKTDSLAPVIYTPAKYVRKVKGSHPGAVMVEKEQVILVKPASPEEIFGKGN